MVVVDEEAFRGLPGTIAMYRAGLALALGDIPGTMKHARRVLDLLPAADHLRRGSAAAILGLASWTSGDLEAGHRSLPRAWPICGRPGTSLTQSEAPSLWRISHCAGSAPPGDAHL